MTGVGPRALIVLLDGVALAEALTGQLRTVRVAARLNRPTQCEAVLAAGPGTAALSTPVRLGVSLEVRLDGQPETLFRGEVTAVEVEYAADGAATLRVRAYDPLHRLRKRQRLRVFESVTVAELAGDLCADLGLRVDAQCDGPRLERLAHHRASDLDLLLAVAGRAGLHLTVQDDVLRLVTLQGDGDPIPLELGHHVHGLRLSVNADTAAGESTALGWHPQRAEPIAQSAGTPRCGRRTPVEPDPADVGADGARTALDQPGRSDDEIAALAQARLDVRAAALVTAEGTAEGDAALRPGRRVRLTGVAEAVAGTYVLTEVVHTLDADGHLTRFSTVPPPAPPAGPPAPAVVTLGTVTDVADPDGLGRVRVELPAYGGADAGWLGVLCPGAGRGKGLVALPDPHDSVLVALPGGEPASGIVLGSLFGAVEPYDAGIDDGRARRWSLRTAGGQQVVIDDVARSLRLSTDAGSWLELTPDLATLHAATDLVLSAPGRAMVVRARSVDFLHAETVEDPDTAAEQARTLARAHHEGGG
ncbi:phage baseplate assembly protein V [Micromonospora maris]|uniref:Type IV secretion protein Rhs n=1 Tax=Micromonospora maris TaxID=1003110 RepID=A0A9X0I1V0_9ACTN|nr:phage baseplate assembly protein V [Micromonospora maris]AEB45876.1 Rhs element Vgr protein [Micromonospora maris AB-18-032]KUJ45197.1 type IV secretion protein Rhs [Micromonospora maris]